MTDSDPRKQAIQQLSRQLRRLERDKRDTPLLKPKRVVSTGLGPLDALLPEGGIYPGSLVEWLGEGKASGAGTLLFLTAASVARDDEDYGRGNLVIVDRLREFYPPAAWHLGIDLQHTIVVRPINSDDAMWALEQSLRCPGVAVVIGFVGQVNERVFRRLQLAAETGGGIGLLLRPARFLGQPSWADIRLHVVPRPTSSPGVFWRRMRVELVRCRGPAFSATTGALGKREGHIELEIHDETGFVRMASQLATSETFPRANRA